MPLYNLGYCQKENKSMTTNQILITELNNILEAIRAEVARNPASAQYYQPLYTDAKRHLNDILNAERINAVRQVAKPNLQNTAALLPDDMQPDRVRV